MVSYLSPRPSYPTPTSPSDGPTPADAMDVDERPASRAESTGTPPRPPIKSEEPPSELDDPARALSQPRFERKPSGAHSASSAAPSPRPRLARESSGMDRKPSLDAYSVASPSSSGGSTPMGRGRGSEVVKDEEEKEKEKKPAGKATGRGRKKAKVEEVEPQLIPDLPVATEEALATFVELDGCMYASKPLGNVRYYGDDDLALCDCSYDRGVDDNDQACGVDAGCVNRLLQIECEPDDCRCFHHCQNQRFQKKEYAPIDIVRTEKKGFGVRAREDMVADTFVYEYVGEVIGPVVFARKMKEYAADGIRHFYFMALDKEVFIDATKKGGKGRFLNHSCNPNCFVAKWTVGKKMRMGIFTKRDIKQYEELTFNYNVDRYGHTAQECYCGEPNCVGFIGGKTQTDIGGMDDLYLDALGIAEEVEALGLRGTKKKKGKHLDDDFTPLLKPIELDEVPKVSAAIRQAITTKRILEKLLTRINMTDDQDVQRQLLRLHGFNLMCHILKEYPTDPAIVTQVLEILTAWPLMARNKVESSKIEEPVTLCAAMQDEPKISRLATALLEEWKRLNLGYRIPRSAKEASASDRKRPLDSTLDSLSKRNRLDEDIPQDTRPAFVKPEATAPRPPPPPPAVLPAGWKKYRDSLSQRYYYENSHSGAVQWVAPTAPAPIPKAASVVDVNSIIARVQAEAEEKAKKEEEEKARKAKARDGVKDRKVLALFSTIVVGVMTKYKEFIPQDQFKKRAKELTTVLCDKEKRQPGYASDPYDRLSPEKVAKVKGFTKVWVKKLIERLRSHHPSPSASASASAVATPSPSASTPRLHPPTPGGDGKGEEEEEGGTPPGTPPSRRSGSSVPPPPPPPPRAGKPGSSSVGGR